MRQHRFTLMALAFLAVYLTLGCATTFKTTHPLEQPLVAGYNCTIGEITDALPADVEWEDHPTSDHIQKLRDYLAEELRDKELFQNVDPWFPNAQYSVEGSVIDFRRGSGVLRFFIGFGAGNAGATIELKLIDRASGNTLFAGNFKQSVSSWTESGDKMFERVAKDFAKQLANQSESLMAESK